MSKPWQQGNKRRPPVRQLQRHLIVCEDEKSAADYLRGFAVSKEFAEVTVEGGAGNTRSVVENALKLRAKAVKNKTPYARVWCVFDRDSFPADRFNAAFDLAGGDDKHDVQIIWSNECFELWYLMHFEFVVAGIGRNELYAKLSEPTRLGRKYDKSDKDVHSLLKDKLSTAKKNARKMMADYGTDLKPERDNPSTNVYVLVAVLEKLAEITV